MMTVQYNYRSSLNVYLCLFKIKKYENVYCVVEQEVVSVEMPSMVQVHVT